MTKNKHYKIIRFLLPVVLMLAGAAGLVMSSSAISSSDYSSDIYFSTHYKADEYQYGYAAIKGLSDAMDEQLPLWREYKYIVYAAEQLEGGVREIQEYRNDGGSWPEYWGKDGEGFQRNIRGALAMTAGGVGSECVINSGISYKADGETVYSAHRDSFIKLFVCVKDKEPELNLSEADRQILADAEQILSYGRNVARRYLPILYPDRNFIFDTMSDKELEELSTLAAQRCGYGLCDREYEDYSSSSYYRYEWLYDDGWKRMIPEASELFTADFDIDQPHEMTTTEKQNFASTYARAKAVYPDFQFDLDAYIEKDDNSDGESGDNNGSNNSDNNSGDTDDNSGDNNSGSNNNDDDNDGDNDNNETPPIISNDATNTPSSETPQDPATPSSPTAPNSGALRNSEDYSTNKTVFTLSMLALVSGVIGMILLTKSYFFSPLKRKQIAARLIKMRR